MLGAKDVGRSLPRVRLRPLRGHGVYRANGAWPAPRGVRCADPAARGSSFPGLLPLTPLLLFWHQHPAIEIEHDMRHVLAVFAAQWEICGRVVLGRDRA